MNESKEEVKATDDGAEFDLDSIATDAELERDGKLFWYGGDHKGVPLIIRHAQNREYQSFLQKLMERNAFSLRGEDAATLAARESFRCEAVARKLVRAWGDGIVYQGEKISGKNLVAGGSPILWTPGPNGGTSTEAWQAFKKVLLTEKYRTFKEQIILWATNDNHFSMTSSEEDGKN